MKRRILLADDSVTIQKVIELTFMDEDFEVRAVSNGDEALALLPEARPDFVIADVHMPGANGYEVCRRSKQLRAEVPVLLLVGTFEPFDENEARSAGADSFLKRPFDSQELLQRVQELLAARPQATPALEPDPTYQVEQEPVFELEESATSFAVQEDVFSAPSELAFEEPHDRYLSEEPAAPAPAAAGFDWAAAPTGPEPVFGAAPEPQPWAAPAPVAAPAAAPETGNGGGHLSDADVDRIARRVVELLGDKTVRDVAWEVIPDMAEVIIRDRLRELESQVE